jgi:hypothetical protein
LARLPAINVRALRRLRTKKEPLESGSEKFGRGCLKGRIGVRSQAVWCKCETGKPDCKKRNCSICSPWNTQNWRGPENLIHIKQIYHTYA